MIFPRLENQERLSHIPQLSTHHSSQAPQLHDARHRRPRIGRFADRGILDIRPHGLAGIKHPFQEKGEPRQGISQDQRVVDEDDALEIRLLLSQMQGQGSSHGKPHDKKRRRALAELLPGPADVLDPILRTAAHHVLPRGAMTRETRALHVVTRLGKGLGQKTHAAWGPREAMGDQNTNGAPSDVRKGLTRLSCNLCENTRLGHGVSDCDPGSFGIKCRNPQPMKEKPSVLP